MTRREARALQTGSVIRSKKNGALRVVVCVGVTKQYVWLVKTGSSWTDPNPLAGYDIWTICQKFTTTDRPRMVSTVKRVLRDYLKTTTKKRAGSFVACWGRELRELELIR